MTMMWLLPVEGKGMGAPAVRRVESLYKNSLIVGKRLKAGRLAVVDATNVRPEDRKPLVQLAREYRRYCWSVGSIEDVRLAPFHLLASEGKVHADQTHAWHMEQLHRLAAAGSPVLLATEYRLVELVDEAACRSLEDWWLGLTQEGGEGIVVKPLAFVPNRRNIQPAVKCRGREYLRIIYGPEYTDDQHLTRLRKRSLGGKRALALREFALGAWRRWSGSSPVSRCAGCMSACSGYWRWSRNRWIRGCENDRPIFGTGIVTMPTGVGGDETRAAPASCRPPQAVSPVSLGPRFDPGTKTTGQGGRYPLSL